MNAAASTGATFKGRQFLVPFMRHRLSQLLALVGLLFPFFGERFVGRRVTIVIANLVPVTGLLFLKWTILETFLYGVIEISLPAIYFVLSAALGPLQFYYRALRKKVNVTAILALPLTLLNSLILGLMVPFMMVIPYIFFPMFFYTSVLKPMGRKESYNFKELSFEYYLKQGWEIFSQPDLLFGPLVFIVLLLVLYTRILIKTDHTKVYDIAGTGLAVLPPPDSFFKQLLLTALSVFWGAFSMFIVFIDRLPFFVFLGSSGLIVYELLNYMPYLLSIALLIKMSVELYLSSTDEQEEQIPVRIRSYVRLLKIFRTRLITGFFFGYNSYKQLRRPKIPLVDGL